MPEILVTEISTIPERGERADNCSNTATTAASTAEPDPAARAVEHWPAQRGSRHGHNRDHRQNTAEARRIHQPLPAPRVEGHFFTLHGCIDCQQPQQPRRLTETHQQCANTANQCLLVAPV